MILLAFYHLWWFWAAWAGFVPPLRFLVSTALKVALRWCFCQDLDSFGSPPPLPRARDYCWFPYLAPLLQEQVAFDGPILEMLLDLPRRPLTSHELADLMEILGIRRVRARRSGRGEYHLMSFPTHRAQAFTPASLRGRFARFEFGAPMSPDFFYESSLRNAALAAHISDYLRALRQARQMWPVDPTDRLAIAPLTKVGMGTPPPGLPPHPHGAHKALERRSVTFANGFLQAGRWFALWLPVEKRVAFGMPDPAAEWNPRIVAKDLTRFRSSLPAAGPQPSSPEPVWFAHDALHHLSPTTVASWFVNNPTLRHALFTTVIPPETLVGEPSRVPALYEFTHEGDDIRYVPEGHVNGSYLQPLSARDWLRMNALHTSEGEHLHVSILESCYAHHLVLISRVVVMPDVSRVFGTVDVCHAPFWSHPTATPAERLTSRSLLAHLTEYAFRVRITGIEDLHGKASALYEAERGPVPFAHKRVAVLAAWHAKLTDAHVNAGLYTRVSLRLASLLPLPFLLPGWLLQSASSRSFTHAFTAPALIRVSLEPFYALRDDPQTLRDACTLERDLFYVPPGAPLLTAFALCNAFACVAFVVKVGLSWPLVYLEHHFSSIGTFLSYVWWVAEWTPERFLLFVVALVLSWWFQLFPTATASTGSRLFANLFAHLPVPLPSVAVALSTCTASIFCLPSSRFRARDGMGYFWQAGLTTTFVSAALPRLISWRFVPHKVVHHMFKLDTTYDDSAWALVVGPIVLLYAAWSAFAPTSAIILPWHSGARLGYTPIADPEATDATPTRHVPPPPPPPPPVNPLLDSWPAPVRVPLPRALPSPAGTLVAPHEIIGEFVEAPLPPPVPPVPALPHVWEDLPPADAFRPWYLFPADFLTLAEFRRVLASYPLPQLAGMDMDHARTCVWRLLADVLGLDPTRLWACYMAQINDEAERDELRDGAVPLRSIATVFAFFRVGLEGYETPAPPANARPSVPTGTAPSLVSTASEGWPSVVACVHPTQGNTYHMVAGAPTPVQGMVVQPLDPDTMVELVSRSVPREEIQPLLNVPLFGKRIAAILAQVVPNASAALCERFGFATTPVVPRPPPRVLPVVPVVPQVIHDYRLTDADLGSAIALASDLVLNPTALKCNDTNAYIEATNLKACADWAHALHPRRSVKITLLHGAPGTGKTHALRQVLQEELDGGRTVPQIRINTWYQRARAMLKRDLGDLLPGALSRNYPSSTRPLFERAEGVMVLDDAGLLWPGFIPLMLVANPTIDHIVCTFDACQAQPPFPLPDAASREMHIPTTAAWLSRMSDHYATASRRLSLENSALFGLPSAAPIPGYYQWHGSVFIVSRAPRGVPYLAASPRFVQVRATSGSPALTFAEAQGLSFDGDIAIDLSGLTSSQTDSIMWMVLTRARGNIFLVVTPAMVSPAMVTPMSFGDSKILASLIAVAAESSTAVITPDADPRGLVALAVQDHMASQLSVGARVALGLGPAAPMVAGTAYGSSPSTGDIHVRPPWSGVVPLWTDALDKASAGVRTYTSRAPAFSELPLVRDRGAGPRLAAFQDALQQVAVLPNDTELVPAPPRDAPRSDAHVEPLTVQADPMLLVNRPPAKELREVGEARIPFKTDQVREGQSELPLRHKRGDQATVQLSYRRRIRTAPAKRHDTGTDKGRSRDLRKGFAMAYPGFSEPGRKGFDPGSFDVALRTQIASWAKDRTLASLVRAVDNSPPDWDPRFTRLFLKSQEVKKLHKLGAPAGPGQVITHFPLTKTFRDSVWATYLRLRLNANMRANIYTHASSTPAALSAWYREHWDLHGGLTTVDFTMWDQSLDRPFLNLCRDVLQTVGAPQDYIDTWEGDKLGTSCFKGPIPLMQFSGDRYTWDFNTVCVLSLAHAAFDLSASTPVAASGDDVIMPGHRRWRRHFQPRQWPLVPKIEHASVGVFCGYQFGREDIGVSPDAVLQRARIGLENGRTAADFWESMEYAISEASRHPSSDHLVATAVAICLSARKLFELPPTTLPRHLIPPHLPAGLLIS
jgi:hypothetical protein